MKGIFSINSPFVKGMTFLGKLVMLNICWVVCSVPIVTLGASTSAMYAMMFQVFKREDEHIFKDYFSHFKKNFKKATAIFFILLVFGALACLEILYGMGGTTTAHKLCLYIGVFGAFIFIVISMFAYIIQAKYENPIMLTIKNSVLVACMSPFTIIKLAIIWFVPVAVSFVNQGAFEMFGFIWLLCGTTLQFYASGKVILAVFDKYIMKEEENGENQD